MTEPAGGRVRHRMALRLAAVDLGIEPIRAALMSDDDLSHEVAERTKRRDRVREAHKAAGTAPNPCPTCGEPPETTEIHATIRMPLYSGFPHGPLDDPKPAAVRHTCWAGHEWVTDVKR